jgi:DMSO/TMAO reductase YedYZ molybdopterin-dependent catalytic subunit
MRVIDWPGSSSRRRQKFPEITMQENSLHGPGAPAQDAPLGLVVRQQEPKNLEGPFGQPNSFLTPTGVFYIRSHFPVPRLDVASYRLAIEGVVRSPIVVPWGRFR